MNGISFRRIRGRIIPIRKAASDLGKSPVKRRIVKAGVAAVAVGAGALKATSSGKSKLSRSFHLAAAYGLQVVSGAVSAIPTRGVARLSAALAGSVVADTLSTASFARAASLTEGSRRTKLKNFAKHQAIGTGVGYATFGAGLLANKNVRAKLASWGAKIAKKVVFR